MQPKVSIVIPCYNKEIYIGGMFDSIIAQKWDNVELILVNDGSTDGTRGVIEEYKSKFLARGYEVVFIDQENQGVAAAVRNGLMRVSGEFWSQVDADDELDPEYVSAMAELLWKYPEEQWVVCDKDRFNWSDSSVKKNKQTTAKRYPYKILESYILRYVSQTLCGIMARTSFLTSNLPLENFLVEPRISQEPQVWISLAFTEIPPIYIQKPLYKYFTRESSITQSLRTYENALAFVSQYSELVEKTVALQKNMDAYKNTLVSIGLLILQQAYACTFSQYDDFKMTKELIEIADAAGIYDTGISEYKAKLSGFQPLSRHISNKLVRYNPKRIKIERKNQGRIIAYAAFGRVAQGIKVGLLNSSICPDVYWDIDTSKECHVNGIDGVPVVSPDFKDLKEDDTILLLLKNTVYIDKVCKRINATPARNNVWYYSQVLDYLANYYYGYQSNMII